MEKFNAAWKRFKARIGGWDLPVLILWAVTLFCIGPFVLLQVFSPENRYGAIPVAIHSQSEADYSRDPRNSMVPVISLDILRDLMLGGEDLEEITFLQTLTATYRPPTGTATLLPTGQLAPQETPTPTSFSDSPVVGTATSLPTSPPTVEASAPVRRTNTVPTEPPEPTTQVPPTTRAPDPSPTTPAPPKPTTPAAPKPSETTPAPPRQPTPTAIVPPTKDTPSAPPTEEPTEPPPPKPTDTPAPKPTNTPAPPPTQDIPITPITFPTKIPTLPGP